ncbi:hypothetical protein SAMN05445756_2192 [Kytococcus aerolatus]|uniref:Uncharacterized protein n=1 Tax=Kytococcus aerolatus TaxID=592308 RepID=A0A212U895_9MICO|nr:hypothetical protein [Kytococcus aerolatus]SNC74274.1 hypothetical protein SAMN05445756_2192 [Kytococcus aerolatus]
MRRVTSGIGAVAVLTLVAGCELPGGLGLSSGSAVFEDGMAVYVDPPSEAEGEPRIIAELTWDDTEECWYTVQDGTTKETTVFLEGTTSTPGSHITLPDGTEVQPGEELIVGGTGWTPDEGHGFTPDRRCGDRPFHFSQSTGPA